ncbi:MAG: hypothetical protein RMJ19_00640, partial [Gemmatales bacterium]|nr:hypothetical protein [Gemmatales bacterium]MDW8174151.1 hypothetical protein [Gemmatales bacterium]
MNVAQLTSLRLLSRLLALALALAWISCSEMVAQVSPEQQAQMLLESAHRALNEKQYEAAIARYREFLQKFPNHPQANRARYGWAVALLEGPSRDYKTAVDLLNPVLGQADFPFRPFAVYYAGWAQRGLGWQALRESYGKPPDQSANLQREAQAR